MPRDEGNLRARTRTAAGKIGLAVGAVLVTLILRTLRVAYWPFTAYDALWVYGYNARIFVLEERIPDEMGYYPQLIPLSYTTMQQAWGDSSA